MSYLITINCLLILLIPILSLTLTTVLSYSLNKNYLIFINFFGIFFTLLSAICLLVNLIFNNLYYNEFEFILFNWINLNELIIPFGLLIDRISILMLFVVSLVSCLVHLYSIEYMRQDPNHIKFLQYLTLFTLSMYILITSNNFIQMFIGWEGVGICSYLLINFWDTRIQANTSAMKAIITNRIGDTCLIAAFILIYSQYNSFNYLYIFNNSTYDNINNYILILLFLGAVGKSAQVFLHIWLPDAMEGPTPVSALIHAATMVTAGIFLIIRCQIIFDLSFFIKKLILTIGAVTALFAGSTGILQNDLKKIIAYSTCSQLGFMCIACGLGQYNIALFHLAMHAFFKALLFLSAGSIIHSFISEEQDIRKMGGLLTYMPLTYISILIGSLALAGFPFTAGYFSKDLIIENLFIYECPISLFALICTLLATICTVIYSFRLIFYVFLVKTNKVNNISLYIHEPSWFMLIPLIVLSFFSIFGGYLLKNIFILDINWNIEELPIFYKLIPFIIFIFTSFLTFLFLKNDTLFNFFFKKSFFLFLNRFLSKKWYFDICYTYLNKFFLFNIYKYLFILGDRGFLELLSSLGITNLFNLILKWVKNLENNNLYGYFFLFIFSLILLLIFLIIL